MRLPIAALAALVAVPASAATHCLPQEQVIFSCPIAKSSRVLSLCASAVLGQEQGSLAYRFGRIGKVELQFPASPEGSLQQFRYAHYFRAQVGRTEVSFTRADVDYTVFEYFDGEQKPSYLGGVSVSTGGDSGTTRTIACSKPARSALQKLENVISCDVDNALASCR
jgi:hypothetical protein